MQHTPLVGFKHYMRINCCGYKKYSSKYFNYFNYCSVYMLRFIFDSVLLISSGFEADIE